ALLEMKLLLRALLQRCALEPSSPARTTRRRAITISPPRTSSVILRARSWRVSRPSEVAGEAPALA
ncbi:MAG TPA: hypothetical protein VNZ05_07675, partial [Solirubrobacteraceae bacterium]|nr:hypothetical protein [Solirubrobacteraceae bacterium]